LRECYAKAAERFGWSRRSPQPRSMREGELLRGMGMATATYPARRMPASAVARLLADGAIVVEAATHEFGTGTYTVMTQMVADVKAGAEQERYSIDSLGAVFADVRVDPDLGDVRVSRIVAAYGAGRILNTKTARSQLVGGIIYGLGMALWEHTAIDTQTGRYL